MLTSMVCSVILEIKCMLSVKLITIQLLFELSSCKIVSYNEKIFYDLVFGKCIN